MPLPYAANANLVGVYEVRRRAVLYCYYALLAYKPRVANRDLRRANGPLGVRGGKRSCIDVKQQLAVTAPNLPPRAVISLL